MTLCCPDGCVGVRVQRYCASQLSAANDALAAAHKLPVNVLHHANEIDRLLGASRPCLWLSSLCRLVPLSFCERPFHCRSQRVDGAANVGNLGYLLMNVVRPPLPLFVCEGVFVCVCVCV